MKTLRMRKIFILVMALTLCFMSAVPVAAATLEMNLLEMIPAAESAKLNGASDKLTATGFHKDGDMIYYALAEGYDYVGILKWNKNNPSDAKVYSCYSDPVMQGRQIGGYGYGDDQDIWLGLWDASGAQAQRLVHIDKNGFFKYVDADRNTYFQRIKTDGIILGHYDERTESRSYSFWNGENTISITEDEANEFYVMHDGQRYFIDEYGKVQMVAKDGSKKQIMDLSPYCKSDYDGIYYTRQLRSAGGQLWACLGSSSQENISGGENIGHGSQSGLVNVTTGKHYSEVPAATINEIIENGDGSVLFITTPYYMAVPNKYYAFPSYVATYTKSGEMLVEKVDMDWYDIPLVYTDETGRQFKSNDATALGITVTEQDETSVLYRLSPVDAGIITVICKGSTVAFDSRPYIQNDRTMVPLRGIAYLTGGKASWDAEAKIATITKEDVEIKLTIGSDQAFVNGAPVTLDAPAEIKGGRTMVPLRFVSETFGTVIEWDGGTKTIRMS